jgi:hypothetical protein
MVGFTNIAENGLLSRFQAHCINQGIFSLYKEIMEGRRIYTYAFLGIAGPKPR